MNYTPVMFCMMFLLFSCTGERNVEYYPRQGQTHWRAVVAFTDQKEVSEDWNWFYGDITAACEKAGIFVSHSETGKDEVDIGPIGKPICRLDLSAYRKKYRIGYLLLEKGKNTLFLEYNPSSVTLKKAGEYFHERL